MYIYTHINNINNFYNLTFCIKIILGQIFISLKTLTVRHLTNKRHYVFGTRSRIHAIVIYSGFLYKPTCIRPL